ncbi:MAG: polysaccharide deacetylase family protein [Candidatus Latescibacterota bacterium]
MILSYHKIDARFEWGITWVTPAQFERQMALLNERGYEAVSVRDWALRTAECGMRNEKSESLMTGILTDTTDPLPTPTAGEEKDGSVRSVLPSVGSAVPQSEIGRTIALSFEDGYASVYEQAWPIMEQYGFRGTLFVVAGYVGKENGWGANFGGRRFRHLDWPQLKALAAAGWEIGSHSWSHRDLTALTTEELTRELRESKRSLEDALGVSVDTLSYPFGRYDERVRDAAFAAGYRGGCVYFPLRDDSFSLAQTAVYRMDTMLDFTAKVTGNVLSGLERFRGRLINSLAVGTPIMQRLGIVRVR